MITNLHVEHCGSGYHRPNVGCYHFYESQTCSCDCPGCNPDKSLCENCYEGKHSECEDEDECMCKGDAEKIMYEHNRKNQLFPEKEIKK